MQDFQNQYQNANYPQTDASKFYNKIFTRPRISKFFEETQHLIVNPQDQAIYNRELFENEDKAYKAKSFGKTGLILGIIYDSIALIFLFVSFICSMNKSSDYVGLLFLDSFIIMCFINVIWIPTAIFSILGLVKSKFCNAQYRYNTRRNSIIGLCSIGVAILLIIISFIILVNSISTASYGGYNSPIY